MISDAVLVKRFQGMIFELCHACHRSGLVPVNRVLPRLAEMSQTVVMLLNSALTDAELSNVLEEQSQQYQIYN